MFVSVNGKAKKVIEIFAGGTDNKAHKITELFGSVDGIARLLFSSAPATTNGFDMFTWAEIKQLANEGKLLEHFNLYDKVTVQLKTPLEKDLLLYSSAVYDADGNPNTSTLTIPQKQTYMIFQIVELTETKMRLMTPRANVFSRVTAKIPIASTSESNSKFKYFCGDWYNGRNQAKSYVPNMWGLSPAYTAYKEIQNLLPDDLVDVLSVCTRPLIKWEKDTLGNLTTEFDEDMKVRPLSTNKFTRTNVTDEETGMIYPKVTESYFPTSISEYFYHIQLPEKYDIYDNWVKLAKGLYGGWTIFQSCEADGNTYTMQNCQSPEASCAYNKGMTSSELSTYNALTYIKETAYKDYPVLGCNDIIPEIIIEADA